MRGRLAADDARLGGSAIVADLDLHGKQHQPEAGGDFGEGHRGPAVLQRRCVFGKQETAETHNRNNGRGKYAEYGQRPGEVS